MAKMNNGPNTHNFVLIKLVRMRKRLDRMHTETGNTKYSKGAIIYK